MRLSKVLLFVICLVVVVSSVNAKVKHVGKAANDTMWVIPKTSVAPVIDGKIDAAWNTVDYQWCPYFNYANGAPLDWSGFSVWAKLMWDAKNIYGLYYVMDDYIDSVSTVDWQMDGVEFYVDPAFTHAVTASLPASMLHASFRPAQKIDSVNKATGKGCKYYWLKDTASINHGGPSGYFVEFSFPLDSLGVPAVAGSKFSLEVQANDNDGAGRIGICKWWNKSGSDDDWQGTQHWGSAILSDDPVGVNYTFLKTSTAPVIDGTMDKIWDQANQLTDASRGNGTYYPATGQDCGYRFYGLYDDKYIYGYYQVMDDVVDSTSATDWQMDGVEIFIDAANTHLTGASLPADKIHMAWRPAQTLAVGNTANAKGSSYAKRAWKMKDDTVMTDGSGYAIEFKIPIDSTGVPATVGSKFSLQLQLNDIDNTAENRIHIQKWWNFTNDDDWQCTLHWGDGILGGAVPTTGVNEQSSSMITGYALNQNYPNPFNPSTEISYSIPKSEKVKLTIFNLLGKQVAELVNGTKAAGSYTVNFSAANLSSGVYFYKLETGSTVLSKKMMLIK